VQQQGREAFNLRYVHHVTAGGQLRELLGVVDDTTP
jgi:hypothetical protein